MNEVAISVKQPWAYLLCAGIKDIENRTWRLPKKYIGRRVYIHASAKPWTWNAILYYITDKMVDVFKGLGFNGEWVRNLTTSAIIGYVVFSECVINHPSLWAERSIIHQSNESDPDVEDDIIIYNWVVSNAVLFDKPIENVKGKLSFWDCSKIIHSELDEYGKPVCMCNLGIDEKDQVISYGDEFRCNYCDGKWYK